MNKRNKGITTIGLVVTIIVMLILAGVTISLMKGNSGIISKADESKSQTERKEVIEKAKMTISEKVVNNGGNELTRSELKEILEQYFINVPEDYTLETILKTKEENGKYEIKVSEIYDRDIMTENEETDGSTEVVPPTSSTNVENGSSGDIGSGGNTGNNVNTGSSTGSTGNTNSESTSGGNSNNTGNGGSNSTEIDVTKVEMDKQTATVDINGENTVQLNAKVIPSNANKNTEITWTSKKKAVASVNQKGLVTGKTVGNSMIMATSQNGYSADCLVVCQAKITGITINPVTANMIVGQKITLTATTSPEIVTEKVTWKSRNEDVAKVDNNGNVTGIGKGVVEIIAQNPGGTIQAVCTVTVKINPTEIRLNYSKLVLDKNSSNIPKLEATILPDTTYVNDSIVWDSSNKNVVTVENGNLTLIENGEAQITVTTQNGYTAQCSITVITPITSLAVSPTSETVYVGNTIQLTGTVNPSNTTESTLWTSSNTDVATVSDTGLVTAKSAGTATITFKNSSGTESDSCTVMVCEEEEIVYMMGCLDVNPENYHYTSNDLVKGAGNIWRNSHDYYPGEVATLENGNVVAVYTSLGDYRYHDDDYHYIDGGIIYIINVKNGNIISTLGENKSTGYSCVASSKDGGFFVGGWFDYNTSYYSNNTGPVNVYKYNSFEKIQWTYNITQNGIGAVHSISATQDNGVVFYYGGYIYKLNENGTLEWKISGASNIAVLQNGNIVTIAESTLKILNSSGSEVSNTKLSSNFNCITTSLDNYIYLAGGNKIAKYDENGKKVWQSSIPKSSSIAGNISTIATYSDGSVVVGTDRTAYLVKYDKDGNNIFSKRKDMYSSWKIWDITIVKK